jgi:hypothetical protein
MPEIKYIIFRKERIPLAKALELLMVCNDKEATELFEIIETKSPSFAITARHFREIYLKVKAARDNKFTSNHKQETEEK